MLEKATKSVSIFSLCFQCFIIIAFIAILFQKIILIAFIPSESMQPGLKPGCILLGTRQLSELSRGDILIFNHNDTINIKRLIGLPEELVIIQENGTITVDGVYLQENYVEIQRSGVQMEFKVPDERLLFLGDNREHSFDARYWSEPYVAPNAVIATARITLYPSITYIGQENIMKKKTLISIILLMSLMLILLIATRFLKNQKGVSMSDANDISASQPMLNQSEKQIGNVIPSFIRGENRDYLAEPLDTARQSPTVLTEEEIAQLISEQLDRLRVLSSNCLEGVSPVTVEGLLNPFYYMIAAAMENDQARSAFTVAGEKSTYQISEIKKTDRNNIYIVSVISQSPYMVSYLQYHNNTKSDYYEQEYTGFVSSGAAESIAGMDMELIPYVTDQVDLFVVIQDDIPIIFYTASSNNGYNIPQYAFLWGFYQFDGIQNGDLQYTNILGAFAPSDKNAIVQALPDSISSLDLTEQVIHMIRQGDWESVLQASVDGISVKNTFLYQRQISSLERLDNLWLV